MLQFFSFLDMARFWWSGLWLLRNKVLLQGIPKGHFAKKTSGKNYMPNAKFKITQWEYCVFVQNFKSISFMIISFDLFAKLLKSWPKLERPELEAETKKYFFIRPPSFFSSKLEFLHKVKITDSYKSSSFCTKLFLKQYFERIHARTVLLKMLSKWQNAFWHPWKMNENFVLKQLQSLCLTKCGM